MLVDDEIISVNNIPLLGIPVTEFGKIISEQKQDVVVFGIRRGGEDIRLELRVKPFTLRDLLK